MKAFHKVYGTVKSLLYEAESFIYAGASGSCLNDVVI